MNSQRYNQWLHTFNHLKNEVVHAPDDASKEAAQKAVDDHATKRPANEE